VALSGDPEADAEEDGAPASFDRLLRRAAAARASRQVAPPGAEDEEVSPPTERQDSSD
jgi:hypothetical protein